MEIKAIRTEAKYLAALIDVDPAAESPEGERLDVLGTVVQAYEAQHYPIAPPDPIEAVALQVISLGEKDRVQGNYLSASESRAQLAATRQNL